MPLVQASTLSQPIRNGSLTLLDTAPGSAVRPTTTAATRASHAKIPHHAGSASTPQFAVPALMGSVLTAPTNQHPTPTTQATLRLWVQAQLAPGPATRATSRGLQAAMLVLQAPTL